MNFFLNVCLTFVNIFDTVNVAEFTWPSKESGFQFASVKFQCVHVPTCRRRVNTGSGRVDIKIHGVLNAGARFFRFGYYIYGSQQGVKLSSTRENPACSLLH